MPRPRQRACLQQGLKLDMNLLAQRGLIAFGSATGPYAIRWVNSDGQEIASGWISADMKGDTEGWLHIQISKFDQRITLSASPCHYGGRRGVGRGDIIFRVRSRGFGRPPSSLFGVPFPRRPGGSARIAARRCSGVPKFCDVAGMKRRTVGEPRALAHLALAPGGESGAVPTALDVWCAKSPQFSSIPPELDFDRAVTPIQHLKPGCGLRDLPAGISFEELVCLEGIRCGDVLSRPTLRPHGPELEPSSHDIPKRMG